MTPEEMRANRLNRGFSIRGLARELEMPEQTVRAAERGEPPSVPNAHKLAEFHGVKVTDIWPIETWDRAENGAAA